MFDLALERGKEKGKKEKREKKEKGKKRKKGKKEKREKKKKGKNCMSVSADCAIVVSILSPFLLSAN